MLKEKLNLERFAEASAAAAADAQTGAQNVSDAGRKNGMPDESGGFSESKKENTSGQVLQSEDNKLKGENSTEKAKRKSFEELICGDYKEEYGKRVEEIVKKRLKNQKDAQSRLSRISPVIEELKESLGVQSDDPDELAQAVRIHLENSEPAAMPEGAEPDDISERGTQDENADAQLSGKERLTAERAAMIVRDLEQTRRTYPQFDISKELSDPEFRRLLGVPGMNVQKAFEIKYHDQILTNAMRYAARVTEEKLAGSMAAKAARPAEGASSDSSAVTIKTDPKSLSKADRAEIKKRVRRGEKIVW